MGPRLGQSTAPPSLQWVAPLPCQSCAVVGAVMPLVQDPPLDILTAPGMGPGN